MDAPAIRARLRDDLRQSFHGEVLLDDLARRLYATDASLFQIEPLAVVRPRDEGDLQTLVRYAVEKNLPLISRGGGTGLAGEALGQGIIVDFSVHWRTIHEPGPDTVRVQPGVVLNQLNAVLAKQGRRFAPDPASGMSCTLGGMLANNASGGKAALHGTTADHVKNLRVVWDDGTAETLERPHPLHGSTRTTAIAKQLEDLCCTHAELLQSSRTKAPFNRVGYHLRDVLAPNALDLVRVLLGSEGTLAFFTEATLKTIPLPGGRAGVVFAFAAFDHALRASQTAREFWPAACEVVDRRLISLARTQSTEAARLVPSETEAALLVEFERETPTDAREAAQKLISLLQDGPFRAMLAVPAWEPVEIEQMWSVRGSALPSLYALGRGARPLAFIEDVGVAPDDLPDFVSRTQAILKRHEVAASFLIHAATGQVHLRPFLDADHPDDAAKLWPMAEEVHSLVIDMGGTVSSQHGTGVARTPWVEKQTGRLFPIYREVKTIFDPRNLLNPGKVVGLDPSRPAWPLRPPLTLPTDATKTRTSLLVWQPDEMPKALAACNGCGACRTEDPQRRMCPVFHVGHDEEASPRAKANMLRWLLERDPATIPADELRRVADLCVNCKMCASECPGRADIPKLMLEAKAENHERHGLRRSDWFLARIEGLSALGSQAGLTMNFLLARPMFRWFVEKLLGLSRRRTLPAFSFRTFLNRARRRGYTQQPTDPGVAYFVDTFANVFDPSIALATMAVLRHNGIPAYVPPKQRGCGSAALAMGDLNVARERLTANIRVLVEAVRAGHTIVCSEPTAALFFQKDALNILPDPEVKLVAEHTVELTTYLWNLHQQGRLKTDFAPLDIALGHHVPCHVKALGPPHGPDLLALIPQLQVNTLDVSCSGMAGPYGLKAKNMATSLAAGKPMLDELARPMHMYGSSECSSCRLQMREGSGKRAMHPVQYLALAYNLMPDLLERLRRPTRPRVSY